MKKRISKYKIKINKIYKEKMSSEEERQKDYSFSSNKLRYESKSFSSSNEDPKSISSSNKSKDDPKIISSSNKSKNGPENISSSNEPKEEDLSWQNEEDSSELLIKYSQYPLTKWAEIIKELDLSNCDEKKKYQISVNRILEKEIFISEQFKKDEENAFLELLNNKKVKKENIKETDLRENLGKITPDFMVLNIEKDNFSNFIKSRQYMVRYDEESNELKKTVKFINLIGEIKNNPNKIRPAQKNRYIKFCNYMNSNSDNEYYLVFYIFNLSYKLFWSKNFFYNNPCIIGYIPQIYKEIKNEKKKEEIDVVLHKDSNKIDNEILVNEFDKEKKENIEDKKIKNVEEGEAKEYKEYNYEHMTIKNLLELKRKKEDEIRNFKIKYEAEEIEMNKDLKNQEENLNKDLKNEEEKMNKKLEEMKKKLEEKEEEEKNNFEMLKNKKKKDLQLIKINKEEELLKKKRNIEDKELELKNITKIYNRKLENDED